MLGKQGKKESFPETISELQLTLTTSVSSGIVRTNIHMKYIHLGFIVGCVFPEMDAVSG